MFSLVYLLARGFIRRNGIRNNIIIIIRIGRSPPPHHQLANLTAVAFNKWVPHCQRRTGQRILSRFLFSQLAAAQRMAIIITECGGDFGTAEKLAMVTRSCRQCWRWSVCASIDFEWPRLFYIAQLGKWKCSDQVVDVRQRSLAKAGVVIINWVCLEDAGNGRLGQDGEW